MAEAPESSFEAFADAYRAAKTLGWEEQLDPEAGTALAFADLCADRVRLSEESTGPNAEADADAWHTEQSTWTLIQRLFAYVCRTYQ